MNIAIGKILVLGGRGFVGRYVVKHLHRLGHDPIIGTRALGASLKPNERRVVFHQIRHKKQWNDLLIGVRVVINCVGILRERDGETFEAVHHHTPALLAQACRERGIRLIHVSALGLNGPVSSEFSLSKRRGEDAIRGVGGDWFIVRASVVDEADGYGSGWFRKIAKWPVHFAPANSTNELSPISAEDLGLGLATLATTIDAPLGSGKRIYEVGCGKEYSVFEYLDALSSRRPWLRIKLPGWLVHLTALVCDRLNLTPLSLGHYELLRYRNAPEDNRIEELIGRAPRLIGAETRAWSGSKSSSLQLLR